MKKSLLYALTGLALCALSTSCWKEEHIEASPNRYRVQNLVGTPGDGEALLSWTVKEGEEAEDYIVKYLDTDNNTVKLRTEGSTSCAIMGLTNGHKYTFGVQAVYGGSIVSGVSSVDVTPSTDRLPVSDAATSPGDKRVKLSWTVPSTAVMFYKVTYYKSGDEGNVQSLIVDGKASEVTIEGLDNDVTYYFTIVAHYAKGDAEPASLKEMPAFAVPFTFEPAHPASGQPVTFRFNVSDFPDATDIVWTMPDQSKLNGAEAVGSFVIGNTETDSNDPQSFKMELSAKVGGAEKKWSFEVPVTPFLFIKKDWEKVSGYQGFKAAVPVFSPDGKTLYVETFANPAGVYAIDAITGEEKWRFVIDPASAAYNGCTVNPVTGDIYFGCSSAGLYALNAKGALLWKNTDVSMMNQTSFPAVSKDGNVVYTHDGASNVCAINTHTGSTIWKQTVSAKGNGLIVNGEELIVACNSQDKAIWFLKTSDGTQICDPLNVSDQLSDCGGIAVSPDRKTGYIGTAHGNVVAFDIVEHRILDDTYLSPSDDNTNCNIWELCVSPSGLVFGGNKRGCVFCLALEGGKLVEKWQGLSIKGTGNGFNYGHPCSDAAGNFYITSGGSKNQNFIYTPTGNVTSQWSVLTGANQKQMAGNAYHNGVFYCTLLGGSGDDGALVAKYVGGEDATTGWPCHGGDICGSCCIK